MFNASTQEQLLSVVRPLLAISAIFLIHLMIYRLWQATIIRILKK